ncbi:RHS repeat protein [Dyella humi]|uniref:RHS repeat protein n=1 Tax=Dyella humi TaxID=1770547 RepID=A0ABW8IIE9_9GAMM
MADGFTEIDNEQGVATSYVVFITALRQYETYDATGLLQSVTDESGQGITLAYSTSSTPANVAGIPGLLLSVTDSKGRQLHFTYDAFNLVAKIILPDGTALTYTHDPSWDNLVAVKYPDGSSRQYVYNESSLTNGASLPYAMTGLVDEAGVRYDSTTYNSSGQAVLTGIAGGVDTTQINYNSDGTSTVQFPLGNSVTMSFSTIDGLVRVASLNQPCGPQCGQPWQTRTYDNNGNPATSVDFKGNTTSTTYNSIGLLIQQVDAQGTTNQRTLNLTWNTSLGLPLTRVGLDANNNAISSTQWIYNGAGQTLARCEIDPSNSATSGYTCSNTGTVPAGVRRSIYTYCTAVDTTQCPIVGLMLTTTGPRADTAQTTTYSYYLASNATNCGTPAAACYQAGDLHTVTDPQGHVTTIASYDADGRITRITDANGINTDMTYTPRGWLASRSVGGAQTSFGYTLYGAVQTVTDSDGVTTTYGYDAAHRLVKITDAQGNYVQYTLDAAGDKTAEQVYDTTGTLHKSLSRTFNTLGQLTTVVDGLNHTVFNASASDSYDANGNLALSTDGLGIQRQLGYDALNRLVQTIDNYNGTN